MSLVVIKRFTSLACVIHRARLSQRPLVLIYVLDVSWSGLLRAHLLLDRRLRILRLTLSRHDKVIILGLRGNELLFSGSLALISYNLLDLIFHLHNSVHHGQFSLLRLLLLNGKALSD